MKKKNKNNNNNNNSIPYYCCASTIRELVTAFATFLLPEIVPIKDCGTMVVLYSATYVRTYVLN